jgi:hypothetical protein
MALTLNTTAGPSALCFEARLTWRLPRRWVRIWAREPVAPLHSGATPRELRHLAHGLSAATRRDLGLDEPVPARMAIWHNGLAPWL